MLLRLCKWNKLLRNAIIVIIIVIKIKLYGYQWLNALRANHSQKLSSLVVIEISFCVYLHVHFFLANKILLSLLCISIKLKFSRFLTFYINLPNPIQLKSNALLTCICLCYSLICNKINLRSKMNQLNFILFLYRLCRCPNHNQHQRFQMLLTLPCFYLLLVHNGWTSTSLPPWSTKRLINHMISTMP